MNFKEALIAYLQGEKVEAKACHEWMPITDHIHSVDIGNIDEYAHLVGLEFRLAPRTITVNGVEVPAPESVAPDDCMLVFCADPASRCYNFCIRWCGDEYKEYLQRGLVYLNKEDAIARAKAMLLHE